MLQSVDKWVQDTAEQMIDGRKLLLRLPPRVGKSYLAGLLNDLIGESAIYVDGAKFTESNQKSLREEIELKIAASIASHNSAQLIFDNYDRALRRTQGPRLQSWLNSRLIDGKDARDIGALFTARCSTKVRPAGAGSPLMSRVNPIDPPSLVFAEGSSLTREWFGESALLADNAISADIFEPVALADRFEQDISYIEDVRKCCAKIMSRGYVKPDDPFDERSSAYGLFTKSGSTKLFERLHPALTAASVNSPVWPDSWAESVTKFSTLVAGFDDVVWSDRYMYRDIEPLRSFLKEVRYRTGCEVKLLGSNELSGRLISRAEMARLSFIHGIYPRWMTQSDFPSLHDRHLITGIGGWVIPQVHVILCRQYPGSAVAAPTSAFGVNYSAVWERSITP